MKLTIRFLLVVSLCINLFSCSKNKTQVSLDETLFAKPPQSVAIHTWWHWLDGAITKEGITKDLEAMKLQGISQATILNIGLFDGKNFDVPQIKFGTPEWFDMFKWALQEANRLGIKIGAHNCDGWSTSGGPWITPEKSMKQYVWSKTIISGGQDVKLELAKPFAEKDFYVDVATVAYKSNNQTNSFCTAKPKASLNDTIAATNLLDGNPVSALPLRVGDKILLSFENDFLAEKIVIHPRKSFMWSDMTKFYSKYRLLASIDGKNFKKVQDIEINGLNKSIEVPIIQTKARYFKIEVLDIANIDAFIAFTLSEVELLQKDEQPAYSPTIINHLEKTVAVKAQQRAGFDFVRNQDDQKAISSKDIVDLTAKMSPDGKLEWVVPEGNWCVVRFGYTTTGVTNGPATKEGIGLECDKMDTAALDLHFNSFPQKMIDAAGEFKGNTFKFLLIDSWECGYQNWTSAMPGEFEKRRGYSLINWIPVLCGDVVENSELSDAFLYDFRKTIAELIENNYYKHFGELCHQQKIEFHAEIIYGDANYPPLDILKTNSYVDLPMFEFWAGHNQLTYPEYTPANQPEASFPAFAATLYNMPVFAAEAYTAMAHYSESPSDLKAFGDRAYCSGINQMILHSYVHQPADKKPGMTLGSFASHFNRQNLWWQHASAWFDYHARIQYVLQRGITNADILYYVGDQLPQYIANKTVSNLPSGYRAVACNYDILKTKTTVKNGKIVLPQNQTYSLLVLPENPAMELPVLERLAELVEQGAVVYGAKPMRQLSYNGITKNKGAFEQLANKLWGNGNENAIVHNKVGKGLVINGQPIDQVIYELGLKPDFTTNDQDSLNLMYIHKKVDGTDVYFVFNQQNSLLRRECLFRVEGKTPEIWNPENGTIIKPAIYSCEKEQIRIPVTFAPNEAMIFVFRKSDNKDFIKTVSFNNQQIFPVAKNKDNNNVVPSAIYSGSNFVFSTEKSGNYQFVSDKGKTFALDLTASEVFEINNFTGQIEFKPAYQATIPPIEITTLKALNNFDNNAIKFFSGTAKYTIKFSIPENYTTTSDSIDLSLGDIASTAKVTLNGKLLGYLWKPTYIFSVSKLLKPENVLEIEVANVYRNRIIGDLIEFGSLKNVWTSAPIESFLDVNKPLKPSGLMGPMKLVKHHSSKY